MASKVAGADPLFVAARCPEAERDRRAWFKATAPVEDVKFTGRHAPLVRREAVWLLRSVKVTRDDARRLSILHRMRARDRECGRPMTPSFWSLTPPPIHSTGVMMPKHTKEPATTLDTAADAAKKAGRSGTTDWVAAGKKAYETRVRNLAAKAAAAAAGVDPAAVEAPPPAPAPPVKRAPSRRPRAKASAKATPKAARPKTRGRRKTGARRR